MKDRNPGDASSRAELEKKLGRPPRYALSSPPWQKGSDDPPVNHAKSRHTLRVPPLPPTSTTCSTEDHDHDATHHEQGPDEPSGSALDEVTLLVT